MSDEDASCSGGEGGLDLMTVWAVGEFSWALGRVRLPGLPVLVPHVAGHVTSALLPPLFSCVGVRGQLEKRNQEELYLYSEISVRIWLTRQV